MAGEWLAVQGVVVTEFRIKRQLKAKRFYKKYGWPIDTERMTQNLRVQKWQVYVEKVRQVSTHTVKRTVCRFSMEECSKFEIV